MNPHAKRRRICDMSSDQAAIESTMQEHRLFPPAASFSAKARIGSRAEYDRMYRESIDQPEQFWGKQAEALHWFKRWDRVLEWNTPQAKWFVGGRVNISYNCPDRIIEQGKGEKVAILGEGELLEASRNNQPEIRRISYKQLKDDVCRFSNGLKTLGVKEGDRVTIYMPMVP